MPLTLELNRQLLLRVLEPEDKDTVKVETAVPKTSQKSFFIEGDVVFANLLSVHYPHGHIRESDGIACMPNCDACLVSWK